MIMVQTPPRDQNSWSHRIRPKSLVLAASSLLLGLACLHRQALSKQPGPILEHSLAQDLKPGPALPLSYIRAGEFELARKSLAALPLDSSTALLCARGMLDLYDGELSLAEAELRSVFDSQADSSLRRLSYRGLQSLFLSCHNFGALESLEQRALIEGILTDTTDWVTARVLRRIGPTTVQSAVKTTLLPFRLSLSRCPILRAQVNGSTPVEFWFDTGASLSVVSDELARRCRVRVFERDSGFAQAATRERVPFRFGVIDSLRIQEVVVRNLPVIVMHQSNLNPGLPGLQINGVIGWPLIAHFRTTISYPNRTIRLEYPDRDSPVVRNMFQFVGLPIVQAQVDSTDPLNFILDTGAQTTILHDVGLRRLVPAPKIMKSPGCIGGAGGSGLRTLRLIPNAKVKVGGRTANRVMLVVHNLPGPTLPIALHGLLGSDVLSRFTVVIDPRNKLVTLR